MGKRKDSAALFEVIKSGPKRLAVPPWIAPTQDSGGGGQALESAEVARTDALPSQEAAISGYIQGRERLAVVDGNRLRLSLNYVSLMVVIAGLALLLAAGFAAGRAGRSGPAASSLGFPQEKLQEKLAEASGFYMIVEPAVDSWGEATAIQKFLYENGIDSGIKLNGHSWAIVDVSENFWYNSPAEQRQKEQLLAKRSGEFKLLGEAQNWSLRSKYNFARAGNEWHESPASGAGAPARAIIQNPRSR